MHHNNVTLRIPVVTYKEITISKGLRIALRALLFPTYSDCSPQNVIAIKALRAELGWGLKEAKDIVDSLTRELLDEPVGVPAYPTTGTLGDLLRHSLDRKA